MKGKNLLKTITFLALFIFVFENALAATLSCQQVSSSSLSIPQFSTKTVQITCSASGGTVSNVQITPNANPSSGLTITSSQTISSSISDSSSSTAKWTVKGDTPNDYEISYTITSDGTSSWADAKTTTDVSVPSAAQLTVDYVFPPSMWTPTLTELDFKINNIGGTTANNIKMSLYKGGTLVYGPTSYPTTIAAGAAASYSWTNETGFNASGTYMTKVYIADVLHDSATTTVEYGSANQTQYAGWNLISLTRVPDDTSVSSLFTSIQDNLTIVWWYNTSDTGDHWKKYDPSANPLANDLSVIDEEKGFWVQTTDDVELVVEGDEFTGSSIELLSGWNMVGYPATEAKLASDACANISSNLSIVWMYNATDTGDHWKKYDPAANPLANDLEYLTPGQGYWYMMTDDSMFEIDW